MRQRLWQCPGCDRQMIGACVCAAQAHLDPAAAQRALEGGPAEVVDHLLAQPHPLWHTRPLLVQLGPHEAELVHAPQQAVGLPESGALPQILQVWRPALDCTNIRTACSACLHAQRNVWAQCTRE